MRQAMAVLQAAQRLDQATAQSKPCAPVRDLLGDKDICAAYLVQSKLIARRAAEGYVRVGRKIGLTSEAVQRQLGVDQPDFGVLLDRMRIPDGGLVPAGLLMQPRIEAEVAFRLATGLDGDVTPERVRGAVAASYAALEIVDSRIAGWDITIVDTVADNASSGLFVISDHEVPIDGLDLASVGMQMRRHDTVVSTGTGSACLGHPLNALAWLASTAAAYGDPLRAGDIVLSGALGPMVPVQPGDTFVAEIGGLGDIAVSFEKGHL
jgi:2-keto-4-pentenoate hydratase